MPAWFVTGTDTNAGKTSVARALLMAALRKGRHAIGYKPIESGCPSAGEPGDDAQALAVASQTAAQTTYALGPPIAPAQAAALEEVTISKTTIADKTRSLRDTCDLLLVEGAGGLLVPITPTETIADLAVTLKLPLLIVAPERLGTINHSLLTIEAARSRGLAIDALILSETSAGARLGLHNLEQLQLHAGIPVMCLPFSPTNGVLAAHGTTLLEELLSNTESGKQLVE